MKRTSVRQIVDMRGNLGRNDNNSVWINTNTRSGMVAVASVSPLHIFLTESVGWARTKGFNSLAPSVINCGTNVKEYSVT